MNTDELIRMANQIARFFASYPEDEALEGIRNHIQSFWEPRMRTHLLAHMDAGGEGLSPLVISALSSTG